MGIKCYGVAATGWAGSSLCVKRFFFLHCHSIVFLALCAIDSTVFQGGDIVFNRYTRARQRVIRTYIIMAIKSIDYGVIRLRKMAQLRVMCPAVKLLYIVSVESVECLFLLRMSMIQDVIIMTGPISFAFFLFF